MEMLVQEVSRWFIPLFIMFVPVLGLWRGVKVYECFVQGAEEGFGIAVRIIPYLVAMMMAVSIFRESGAMDAFARLGRPVFELLNIPPEVLPLALMRPLSGGGSLGIAAELITTYGPDSLIGRLASTMQGSTDTTFFIIAVYFGSVGVYKYRYSITVGLLADLTTFIASIYLVNLIF